MRGRLGRRWPVGCAFLLETVQTDGIFAPGATGSTCMGMGLRRLRWRKFMVRRSRKRSWPKLEKLVKLIVSSQNAEGGWRYRPTSTDADMSATVLQVVALRAARNAGLEVPEVTIKKAVQYVRSCRNGKNGGFAYQPRGSPGFARTAAAIYSLQVCGEYDDLGVKTGSEYLFEQVARDEKEWFTYGSFIRPALYMIGGATWEQWYREVKKVLLEHVQRDGELVHWEPVLDSGQTKGLGSVYCTAVYTTILAIPYNYIPSISGSDWSTQTGNLERGKKLRSTT